MTEARDLEAAAAELGVLLGSAQSERLLQFATLLRRWNVAFNLVSRNDLPRLVERHLLDSLSLLPLLCGSRVLDLGTGAGLPGLPLAIACPDARFTLIDRSERRIRFVRQAAIELGLQNVDAVEADYMHFRADGEFDTVVSRAVAKPAALWRVAEPALDADGQALFQTGPNERDVANVTAVVERLMVRVPGLARLHHVLRVRKKGFEPKDADR